MVCPTSSPEADSKLIVTTGPMLNQPRTSNERPTSTAINGTSQIQEILAWRFGLTLGSEGPLVIIVVPLGGASGRVGRRRDGVVYRPRLGIVGSIGVGIPTQSGIIAHCREDGKDDHRAECHSAP